MGDAKERLERQEPVLYWVLLGPEGKSATWYLRNPCLGMRKSKTGLGKKSNNLSEVVFATPVWPCFCLVRNTIYHSFTDSRVDFHFFR